MKFPRINKSEWRRKLVDRLKSRIKIPLIKRTISLWAILALFIFLGLATAGGIVATNRSVFCSSCHEMDVQFRTWKMSSHKNIECEQCHVVPGVTNMIKSKIMSLRLVYLHVKGGVKPEEIKGHVSNVNCKECHQRSRDIVVYHGLKITHKKHWNMGIGCTFCHDRVVHGPSAATKNTPKMATCFKCHDGKKTSNECGVCHETLGIRKASVFSKEWVGGHKQEVANDKNSCKRCHQSDFCDNCHRMSTPHPAKWMDKHADEFTSKKQDCKMCHSDSFCSDCHQVKQAHKLGWMDKHQAAFRSQPESCNQCHQRTFCSDCHVRYRPHPEDWTSKHAAPANANPGNCKTCHEDKFCVACHKGTTPTSHKNATFLRTHGDNMSRSKVTCTECHNSNFCLKCHKEQKPVSHLVNWQKLHPIQAKMNSKACDTCHSKGSCQKCHGMLMPHPKQFKSTHPKYAKADKKSCQRCHEQQFCASCHRGSRPANHSTGWVNNHGQQGRTSATCNDCHTKIFCDACHTSTMPLSHKGDWNKQHGGVAKKTSDSCKKCHSVKSCDNCHAGQKMPHPANYTVEHKDAKGASRKPGSLCLKCHDISTCNTCHSPD